MWVNPRTQRGKQLGGLAIGLVFAALAAGCVAMMVVEKTLIPLVALALVGLAMFGWYTSQRQANARATSSTTINPALVVDDSGVGDAAVRIPWSDIARVDVISLVTEVWGRSRWGLAPSLPISGRAAPGYWMGSLRLRWCSAPVALVALAYRRSLHWIYTVFSRRQGWQQCRACHEESTRLMY